MFILSPYLYIIASPVRSLLLLHMYTCTDETKESAAREMEKKRRKICMSLSIHEKLPQAFSKSCVVIWYVIRSPVSQDCNTVYARLLHQYLRGQCYTRVTFSIHGIHIQSTPEGAALAFSKACTWILNFEEPSTATEAESPSVNRRYLYHHFFLYFPLS